MTSTPSDTPPADGSSLGFEAHDHTHCVATALAAAEATCRDAGLRFTPVRRKVLEILLREHRAMGAYAILDVLGEEGFGTQPPVAYRALDFLTENGFCHKIERLNAFVACAHPGRNHTPAFMICRICDAVAETHSAPAKGALGDAARAVGFHIEKTVVEAEGVCPACLDKANA